MFQHGPGALPRPAVSILPCRLHLRQKEQHPLRLSVCGSAARLAPSAVWAGLVLGAGSIQVQGVSEKWRLRLERLLSPKCTGEEKVPKEL